MTATTPGRPDVVLVRHGATEWSVSGRHTGRTDLPLLDEGRDQADAAGARLEGRTFALVLVSPLERARETCERAGYGAVAEAMFSTRVDAFFLEYDDERSGGFEPLKLVPKGKKVVLGLVTSKRPAMEAKDELKRRIDEAAKYVPFENLALSPQCGFSSTIDGNPLTQDEQKAKLRLCVEVANEVWGGV